MVKRTAKQLKVTLQKSLVRRTEKQQACVKGLGLKRINQSVLIQDNPCIRGMIEKVSYMLKVEEV